MAKILTQLAVLADTWGIPLNEVIAENVHKLRMRYPEGFDAVKSRARHATKSPK